VYENAQVFNSIDSLLDALVYQWKKIAEQSIADHDAFYVALAGGGTPKDFYARLAQPDVKDTIPWEKVHVYFGDERYVPQNDADSNFRMANETLFSKVSIPATQVHAMVNPSLSPEENAARYASLVDQQLVKDEKGRPVFDLILLGMGGDGHTASLFPNTEILNEDNKTVAAQFVDKLNVWRVSLTYPTLNSARHVAVLVVGGAKAEIVLELEQSSDGKMKYPIKGVHPQGELHWFFDQAATHQLTVDPA